ncbi:hypothetical protein, variant [Sphaeroforma arctica JP610]|uniref:SGNH domain-containing protein n=1 Tax=Sphaeroforma arctica JP610 TaxID=667725 RepID=A0A0L0G1I1_9EUKA|nr:hypothetical protein, variant [Sphaeroforma arctica JP610]KNC82666.1 hypothetical protein, variant [Sphaeroforma arctica JP610]|eukprot:XP_014156568.1 hypothetical protein, variant [Sphaeroforma arctica JP610]
MGVLYSSNHARRRYTFGGVHKTSSDVDASTFTDGAVKHVVLFLGDYNDRYAVKEFCGKVMKRRMQSQKHIQKALKREYKEAREDIVDSHKQSSAYIPDVDFLSSIQLDYCDNNFAVIASVMNKYGMSPTGPWYGSRAENMLKLPAPNSAAQHYALLIGPAIKALEMLTGNRVTHVVASSNYYDIGRTYVWESHFNADENDFWSHTVIPQWKAHWQGFVDFATSLVPNDEILWHTSNMPLCPDEAAPNSFVSPWLVQCKRVDELNTAVRQTIGNNPRVKLLDFEESLKLVQPNEYLLSDKEHLNRKFLAILMQNCLTALGLNMRFG